MKNANRVLAVFASIPKEDWEAVLFLVNRYFERMGVLPRRPSGSREEGTSRK